MDESERGRHGQEPAGGDSAVVASGLVRLVADAVALALIDRSVLSMRIGRTLPLLAGRCRQLGFPLPPIADLPALSAIAPAAPDPAALRRGLALFLDDIETVVLLAAHARDRETSRLLEELHAAALRLARAVDRRTKGGRGRRSRSGGPD
jgi:hypothetical protein